MQTARLPDPPVTLVQEMEGRTRRRRLWVWGPIVLILLVAAILFATNVWRLFKNEPDRYANIGDHFKYGSIGSEPESGLPYWMWKALPVMFENELGPDGLRVFGFLYEEGHDLPIGVSRRNYRGVELAWLNCAVCHTGTYTDADGERRIVLGMPSNNLDFEGFVRFLFDGIEKRRLTPASVMDGMRRAGARFGPVDWALYRFYVIPRVLRGLKRTRDSLGAIMAQQVAWGPGRVDTFNPYKAIQFGMRLEDLDPSERHGVADLPSIFQQGPRGEQEMELHWDGDNASLQERNLSAAIGAGVTERTVDHVAIERVAEWLRDLHPPHSPYRVDNARAAEGRGIYMRDCADCHGYQDAEGYVFSGRDLGRVTPIEEIRTDRGRLDSYTEKLRDLQLSTFFKDDPEYDFKHFTKTNGYANQPLDGLWLRAPYLHNGSVPTLRDLLNPPGERPVAFVRGDDKLDPMNGGFRAETCDPEVYFGPFFCFDTRQKEAGPDRGNRNIGHLYGTELPPGEKEALLEYLKTF
jgi:hypothetical protein